MRFLHCSDVHITGDYRSRSLFQLGWRRMPALGELYLKGRYRNFQKAPETLRQIMTDAGRHRAAHVIVSGDLTATNTGLAVTAPGIDVSAGQDLLLKGTVRSGTVRSLPRRRRQGSAIDLPIEGAWQGFQEHEGGRQHRFRKGLA